MPHIALTEGVPRIVGTHVFRPETARRLNCRVQEVLTETSAAQ